MITTISWLLRVCHEPGAGQSAPHPQVPRRLHLPRGVRQRHWPVSQAAHRACGPAPAHAPPTGGDAGFAVIREDVAAGAGAHHGALLLTAELVTVTVVQAAGFPHGCGDTCRPSGLAGDTEAAGSREVGQQHQGRSTHCQPAPLPRCSRGVATARNRASGTGPWSRLGARGSVCRLVPALWLPHHMGPVCCLPGPGRPDPLPPATGPVFSPKRGTRLPPQPHDQCVPAGTRKGSGATGQAEHSSVATGWSTEAGGLPSE